VYHYSWRRVEQQVAPMRSVGSAVRVLCCHGIKWIRCVATRATKLHVLIKFSIEVSLT
jgi:hypothetical protein